jgi:hypothetical protein
MIQYGFLRDFKCSDMDIVMELRPMSPAEYVRQLPNILEQVREHLEEAAADGLIPGLRFKKATLHALQFVFEGIDIDLLPAPAYTSGNRAPILVLTHRATQR